MFILALTVAIRTIDLWFHRGLCSRGIRDGVGQMQLLRNADARAIKLADEECIIAALVLV